MLNIIIPNHKFLFFLNKIYNEPVGGFFRKKGRGLPKKQSMKNVTSPCKYL